jgi:hypothetical protein
MTLPEDRSGEVEGPLGLPDVIPDVLFKGLKDLQVHLSIESRCFAASGSHPGKPRSLQQILIVLVIRP